MREILFRAKREFDGTVGEGLYDFQYGYYIRMSKSYHYLRTLDGKQIMINPDTLCEFTGLHDCKGTKIFEGDIIQLSNSTSPILFKEGGFGYIMWEDFISFSGHNHLERILSRIQVIGNIYDNPELLEEK